MILGFSAKKQGGKTTAIKSIQENLQRRNEVCVPINFADMLKILVVKTLVPMEMLGVAQHHTFFTWIEENKDTILPCGITVRQALQKVGTDWFRSLYPDAWVNAWKQSIKIYQSQDPDNKIHIIVGDVRFPNEVKAIQEMDGHVIRLLRNPFPEDQHESETALDLVEQCSIDINPRMCYGDCEGTIKFDAPEQLEGVLQFDAIIDNTKMSIEEQNKAVWDLIKENGWLKNSSDSRIKTFNPGGIVR